MGEHRYVTPTRDLTTTLSDAGRHLYRTEWRVGAELVGATPWVASPVEAIRDGRDADREYAAALAGAAA